MTAGPPSPVVALIGLGNPYRRDDGIGRLVAVRAALASRPAIAARLPGDSGELLDAWAGADVAVVVDALRSGADPGSVHRLSLDGDDTGRPEATSSHSLGIGAALRLSRSLGRAPREVIVIGVEGADFGPGEGLSPAVAAAVPAAVDLAVAVMRSARHGSGRAAGSAQPDSTASDRPASAGQACSAPPGEPGTR